jgi:small redox-active disulfide protein 2
MEGRRMKVEVLGIGCTRCNKLYQNVLTAVRMSGQEAQVTKVEDIQKIASYGVMSVPALVVDGLVKVAGKILAPEEIKQWIE